MANEIETRKDNSGIFLMLTYKNVLPYSATRNMVGYLMDTAYNAGRYKLSETYYRVNRESIITEIIKLASDGELTDEDFAHVIEKYNQ